jgi:hypothetical protein
MMPEDAKDPKNAKNPNMAVLAAIERQIREIRTLIIEAFKREGIARSVLAVEVAFLKQRLGNIEAGVALLAHHAGLIPDNGAPRQSNRAPITNNRPHGT